VRPAPALIPRHATDAERSGAPPRAAVNLRRHMLRAVSRIGVLFIVDGEYRKKVELDTTQLQNGSIIYRKLSSHVAFRVEVYPKDHVTISETADWKQ